MCSRLLLVNPCMIGECHRVLLIVVMSGLNELKLTWMIAL